MELVYSLSDIYPNSNGWETGSLSQIDAEDKEVLEENYVDGSDENKASFKKIAMAVLLIVLMVVFFGVGGGK